MRHFLFFQREIIFFSPWLLVKFCFCIETISIIGTLVFNERSWKTKQNFFLIHRWLTLNSFGFFSAVRIYFIKWISQLPISKGLVLKWNQACYMLICSKYWFTGTHRYAAFLWEVVKVTSWENFNLQDRPLSETKGEGVRKEKVHTCNLLLFEAKPLSRWKMR